MLKLVLVAVMGGLGSVARYLVSTGADRYGKGFPLGTLIVNAAGCLIAGVFAAVLTTRLGNREEWRVAILVGFLGGFTTFSAFGVETLRLWNAGRASAAALNVLLNVSLGLIAVWLGWRLVYPR
jgi:fluoride exporter